MDKLVNHKRYIHTIQQYKAKKQQFKTLEAIGYYKFLMDWDDHLRLSLSGISDALSEEHSISLLEIRNRASDVFLYSMYFYTKDPDDFDSEYFSSEIKKLFDQHHQITTEYKIEEDLKDSKEINQYILALNDATFILSKPSMKGDFPSMQSYVSNALEYFKNKKEFQIPIPQGIDIINVDPENSNIPDEKRFRKHSSGLTRPEFVLMLFYTGITIKSKEHSVDVCTTYGFNPSTDFYDICRGYLNITSRRSPGENDVKHNNKIKMFEKVRDYIEEVDIKAWIQSDINVLKETLVPEK
jgi:hypothetical protein